MAGPVLAIVTPDNIPGGSILTFALPMALFIVAAAVLYLLFTRPHQVPGHKKLAAARASSGTPRQAPAGHQARAVPAGDASGAAGTGGPGSGPAAGGSAVGGGSAAPAEGSKADD